MTSNLIVWKTCATSFLIIASTSCQKEVTGTTDVIHSEAITESVNKPKGERIVESDRNRLSVEQVVALRNDLRIPISKMLQTDGTWSRAMIFDESKAIVDLAKSLQPDAIRELFSLLDEPEQNFFSVRGHGSDRVYSPAFEIFPYLCFAVEDVPPPMNGGYVWGQEDVPVWREWWKKHKHDFRIKGRLERPAWFVDRMKDSVKPN